MCELLGRERRKRGVQIVSSVGECKNRPCATVKGDWQFQSTEAVVLPVALSQLSLTYSSLAASYQMPGTLVVFGSDSPSRDKLAYTDAYPLLALVHLPVLPISYDPGYHTPPRYIFPLDHLPRHPLHHPPFGSRV